VKVCTRVSLRSFCSSRTSSLFLSNWSRRFVIKTSSSLFSDRSWAYGHKLIMNLTSVLFRWSQKVSIKWTLYSQQWSFIFAQRHCRSTVCCSSDGSVASMLFVKVSLCHCICRSFCNWHSTAFWIQVPASLLLPAQSTVKDIKAPSGNYSPPSFKECKQIMLCNYMAHVCLTKRNIMQKIRHVFYDIHYLTEVIQFVNFPQCRTD